MPLPRERGDQVGALLDTTVPVHLAPLEANALALDRRALAATRAVLFQRKIDRYPSRVRARMAHLAHTPPAAGHTQQRLLDDVLRGRASRTIR